MNLLRIALRVAAGTACMLAAAPAYAEEPPPPPAAPPAAPALPPPQVVVIHDRPSTDLLSRDYRSPGLAAALSLTPVPVDFGNLYAENVGWGIAYTSVEVALMGGMMWLGVGHMCHDDASGCGDWSDMERNTMIGLVAGYVVVKIASGVHAASAAGDFNRAHSVPGLEPSVAPTTGGAVLGLTLRL